MVSGWSEARRERQSEEIRRWRPWEDATGPRTVAGKAASSRNAWKGGHRTIVRGLSALLREQRELLG